MRDELVKDRGEGTEFVKMGRGEAAQAGLTFGGEPDPRDAAVTGIRLAFHQPPATARSTSSTAL